MALTNWFAAALALIAPNTVDVTVSFHVDCTIPPPSPRGYPDANRQNRP
jgi:hypothetical protein